ncbi:elongation factor P hydroxylase [Psychrobacter jeotgali]|uniref:elongation factor P hydroxylase n=1 Tax=Psychrobacter jeotgali TaxID=179010 RepID=UPI001D12AFC5|nr:elongation factor P hydroxylase [Psychrobacter jeotgali]
MFMIFDSSNNTHLKTDGDFVSSTVDFSSLLNEDVALDLSAHLDARISHLDARISPKHKNLQYLITNNSLYRPLKAAHLSTQQSKSSERQATDVLISLFDLLFAEQNVELIRGSGEPEYFPANNDQPARIEFAHGFFASALHEISHWCIAGEARRKLADFGYWYAADGRSAAQQQAFERLEIKPQALECLFSLACQRPFQVSQDNLFADFDTSNSTFPTDVYQQASHYINHPNKLPRDAQLLLWALLTIGFTR